MVRTDYDGLAECLSSIEGVLVEAHDKLGQDAEAQGFANELDSIGHRVNNFIALLAHAGDLGEE
jgi:hypothetical protein